MLLRLLTFSVIFSTMLPFLAQATTDKFKWKNRLLIIFTPDRTDPFYRQQIQNYDFQLNGVHERDFKRIDLIALTQSVEVDGIESRLSYKDALKDFSISQNRFQVLLVGKDGEIKRRWSAPVTMDEVFNEVDAMPMRQREMMMTR